MSNSSKTHFSANTSKKSASQKENADQQTDPKEFPFDYDTYDTTAIWWKTPLFIVIACICLTVLVYFITVSISSKKSSNNVLKTLTEGELSISHSEKKATQAPIAKTTTKTPTKYQNTTAQRLNNQDIAIVRIEDKDLKPSLNTDKENTDKVATSSSVTTTVEKQLIKSDKNESIIDTKLSETSSKQKTKISIKENKKTVTAKKNKPIKALSTQIKPTISADKKTTIIASKQTSEKKQHVTQEKTAQTQSPSKTTQADNKTQLQPNSKLDVQVSGNNQIQLSTAIEKSKMQKPSDISAQKTDTKSTLDSGNQKTTPTDLNSKKQSDASKHKTSTEISLTKKQIEKIAARMEAEKRAEQAIRQDLR